jgi:hypothetical protein
LTVRAPRNVISTGLARMHLRIYELCNTYKREMP